VLVLHDILGLNPDKAPAFAKRYLEGRSLISAALSEYADDVRHGKFPA
jgi:3-methyl-2-oxobutanoate hydroxymethyltransferase